MNAPRPWRLGRGLLDRQWITGGLAVLLILSSLLLGWQWEKRQNAAQIREDSGQALILAGSLAGALAFDDIETTEDHVSALRRDESIRAAAAYDEQGRMVAGFSRPGETLPQTITAREPMVDGGTLTIVEPVREGSLSLGFVYLRTSIEPLSARLSRYLAIGLVLLMAALLIALLGAANAAAVASNRQLREEIEAREMAERALRQAQKMEALGQLTGGVAHDFNNLLMAATSGLELLDRAKTDERRATLKAAIRDALHRGARITEQLLAFSRRRPLHTEVLEIDKHVGKLAELLNHSLREDISVDYRIADDLWPVKVDVSQFDIAVLNLALNAKDAMPRGGELCIAAENRPGGLEGNDAVEISVKDEGVGMSAEELERAFEPFFTTKGVGKGTGLGLSQVFGFARASSGQVLIESEKDRGTKVTLLLPRSEEADKGSDDDAEQSSPGLSLAKHRILLVEDDPHLNDLIRQMLEEHGAKVFVAGSGEEGLAEFSRHKVDAVLSDMVMPGTMSGLDLARELRRRGGALKIVLMTGYSEGADAALAEGFALLRKPFDLGELARALNCTPSQGAG
jgi:signal transduction histidine kinase